VLERSITDRLLGWLNKQPDTLAIKLHSGALQGAGDPDILGVTSGRCFAFEVKRVGEVPTPLQAYRLERWKSAGAIAGRVDSVDDVRRLIAEGRSVSL
jgi:hypothetical protein